MDQHMENDMEAARLTGTHIVTRALGFSCLLSGNNRLRLPLKVWVQG